MMPRPWSDLTGNTVLEGLSEISRLAEIGMVAGLNDEQSERFIALVQRMADALPPPVTHP
jgi:hypothetical protein